MTNEQIANITAVRDQLEAWAEFAELRARETYQPIIREQAQNQRDNYRHLIGQLDDALRGEQIPLTISAQH